MKLLGEEQGVGVEGGAGGDAARQPIYRELEVWLPLQSKALHPQHGTGCLCFHFMPLYSSDKVFLFLALTIWGIAKLRRR